MKFTVGTNWQDDLIPRIKRDSVEELYGKLVGDFVGGGRPSFISAAPSKERVHSHIKEAHRNGLKFNYLLSAACLGNKEFTASGKKKILELLDWVTDMEVDSVTVAIPFLLRLIKKRYPELKVHISSFANVSTIERARYWEDMGADRLNLDEFTLNRDFQVLRQIRKSVSCQLQLIANNGCLYNCPFVPHHGITISHSSQSEDKTRGFFLDYCVLSCKYLRLTNPVNFIRADWIRPEDLGFYEDAGIDSMKLVDRTRPTDAIALVVDAYDKREYRGNLIDLIPSLSTDSFFSGKEKILRGFKYFFRPFDVNISSICKSAGLDPKLHVSIDNSELDGFVEHFLKTSCRHLSCKDCGYCEKVARRVVRIDPDYQRKSIAKYKNVLNSIF